MGNYVITIARGFGSGGKQIAMQLADELGIECYENRILTLASRQSGYEPYEFKEVDEKLEGSYVSRQLAKLQRRITPFPVTTGFSSNDTLFAYQADIIKKLADNESCIIVGKCADYLLKDRKNVLSVYIEAPRELCRARIVERMGVSASEADELISKTDKYRAEYYKYYTNGNYWTNPVNYDVTLNSQRVGVEYCAEAIKRIMQMKFGPQVLEEMRETSGKVEVEN